MPSPKVSSMGKGGVKNLPNDVLRTWVEVLLDWSEGGGREP